MALTPRLELRPTQTLVMTPQLQQAIKLLQLSNLELTAYIEQELEQNPLLEREVPEGGSEAAAREDSAPEADGAGDADSADWGDAEGDPYGLNDTSPPDTADLASRDDLTGSNDAAPEADHTNSWDADGPSDMAGGGEGDSLHWNEKGGGGGFDEDNPNLEQSLSESPSLREHLIGQLNVDVEDPADRMIGLYLIDSLDEAGYLTIGIETVAEALNCDAARAGSVLDRLRHFDPPGVFARDLADCLALQLRDKDRLDPAMQALMEHLDLLAKRDFNELKRICGVDSEDLLDMIAEIKALNPKPAQLFDNVVAEPVTPDVLMRRRADGGWLVELNNDSLPRVLVNRQYHAIIAKQARNKRDKEFITERMQSANWLVKALHQRAQTILKVASELVSQQDGFFHHGVEHLKPLTLRDVAEEVGVHESTVSRVTNNKYIATPRGVFELKYFFTSAVSRADSGDMHSAEAVRFRIKGLIDKEAPGQVLSDDMICELLRQSGVDIARRTVAKYREAMHIPSSVQRRREKSLSL